MNSHCKVLVGAVAVLATVLAASPANAATPTNADTNRTSVSSKTPHMTTVGPGKFRSSNDSTGGYWQVDAPSSSSPGGKTRASADGTSSSFDSPPASDVLPPSQDVPATSEDQSAPAPTPALRSISSSRTHHVRPMELSGSVVDCPASITNYTGAKSAYNCEEMVIDFSGHPVKLRTGRSDSAGSAFGILHAYIDHGVTYGMLEDAIPKEYGYSEGQLHRYDYLATYHDENGTAEQTVQITEDRDTNSSAPDHYELGLLTAFCRIGGTSGSIEHYCPSWVVNMFP